MERTLSGKVSHHEEELVQRVLGTPVPGGIFLHILTGKFKKSSNKKVVMEELSKSKVEVLLRHIVKQKFEQRVLSEDVYDDFISFLSGEQQSQMEISYTKQHQKQKQKQQNKTQDSDTMGVFDKKNQLALSFTTDNYFEDTISSNEDLAKMLLNVPVSVPILSIAYDVGGFQSTINVYPTLQFLYSHHICGAYIDEKVQGIVKGFDSPSEFYASFFKAVECAQAKHSGEALASSVEQLFIKVKVNLIRQNPQYSIAALKQGIYIIGMKDQFNIHDLKINPLNDHIQYVADEMGFILSDKTNSKDVTNFGPYFIEQYIMMEVLSKQEVAQNVLDYYCKQRDTLQRALSSYNERQGKGFICWRFLINETAKAAAAAKAEAKDTTGSSKSQ